MTDREAIGVMECMAIDLTGAIAGLSEKNPMEDVLKQRIVAINTAQVALQERIERETVCDWCQRFEDDPQYLVSRGNGQYDEVMFEYCPVCGRKLKPAMPGEAARLFLRVKGVRVERLQDIDDDGAKAEGANYQDGKNVGWEEKMRRSAIDRFAELWDNTVKPEDRATYGWEANPWVFVIEFERISKDEALGGGGDG